MPWHSHSYRMCCAKRLLFMNSSTVPTRCFLYGKVIFPMNSVAREAVLEPLVATCVETATAWRAGRILADVVLQLAVVDRPANVCSRECAAIGTRGKRRDAWRRANGAHRDPSSGLRPNPQMQRQAGKGPRSVRARRSSRPER